ncbi:hypothetical protein AB3N58_07300 [Leptospira sp. WS60.C2]
MKTLFFVVNLITDSGLDRYTIPAQFELGGVIHPPPNTTYLSPKKKKGN